MVRRNTYESINIRVSRGGIRARKTRPYIDVIYSQGNRDFRRRTGGMTGRKQRRFLLNSIDERLIAPGFGVE
jgi:hypothetical protein